MSNPANKTINAPVVGNVSGGAVRVSNTTINNHHQHTHHHQHNHAHTVHAHGPVVLHTHFEPPAYALQAPPAPQARYRQRNKQVVQPITQEQKDLLEMMRPLPKPVRNGLLEWMRAEFGTGLVMELDLGELQLARQRVLDARRAAGI